MLLRVYGIIALLAGLFLVFLAWKGLQGIGSLELALTQAMPSQGFAFDPSKWNEHYRAYLTVWMIAGVATTFAGIAMLLLRRWGMTLFAACALVLLLYPFVLQMTATQHYAFERISYGQEVILAVVFLLAILGRVYLKKSVSSR